jgi:hypothetical protein
MEGRRTLNCSLAVYIDYNVSRWKSKNLTIIIICHCFSMVYAKSIIRMISLLVKVYTICSNTAVTRFCLLYRN